MYSTMVAKVLLFIMLYPYCDLLRCVFYCYSFCYIHIVSTQV